MQFGFHAVTDHRESFMYAGIELFGREAVRKFDFDGRVVGLAAVLGVSRDFLGVGSVEFQHGWIPFKKFALGNDELPRAWC